MRTAESVVEQLLRVFPQRQLKGPAAPHGCEECSALSAVLDSRTWSELTSEFLEENAGVLPLLTQDAYRAFLAAWLREGALKPDSDVGQMVLINLWSDPDTSGFTRAEARAIIDVARHIGTSNFWGRRNDPENAQKVAAVERIWSQVDA